MNIPRENMNINFKLTANNFHKVFGFREPYTRSSLQFVSLEDGVPLSASFFQSETAYYVLDFGSRLINDDRFDITEPLGMGIKNNTGFPLEILIIKDENDTVTTWNEDVPYTNGGLFRWNNENSEVKIIAPYETYSCRFFFRPTFESLNDQNINKLTKLLSSNQTPIDQTFYDSVYVKIKDDGDDNIWRLTAKGNIQYPSCLIPEIYQEMDFGEVNFGDKKVDFLRVYNHHRYDDDDINWRSITFSLPNNFSTKSYELRLEDNTPNWNDVYWDIPVYYKPRNGTDVVDQDILFTATWSNKNTPNEAYLSKESGCEFTLKAYNDYARRGTTKLIEINKSNIDFGTISLDEQKSETILITNISEEEVSIYIGNYDDGLSVSENEEFNISSGESKEVTISNKLNFVKLLEDSIVEIYANRSLNLGESLTINAIPEFDYYLLNVNITNNDDKDSSGTQWRLRQTNGDLLTTIMTENPEKWNFSDTSIYVREGTYKLEHYSPDGHWIPKEEKIINLIEDTYIDWDFDYLPKVTTLKVELLPVGISARWRIIGESSWRENGSTYSEVDQRINIRIEFEPVLNYVNPETTTVYVENGLSETKQFQYEDVSLSVRAFQWVRTNGPSTYMHSYQNSLVFEDKIFRCSDSIVGSTSGSYIGFNMFNSTDGYNWNHQAMYVDDEQNGVFDESGLMYAFNNKMFYMCLDTDSLNLKIYESEDGYNWYTEKTVSVPNQYHLKRRYPTYDYSNIVEFKGSLYCIGYEMENTSTPKYKTSGVLWTSTDGRNWNSYKNMPFSGRAYSGLFSFNNKLWLIGGKSGTLALDVDLNDIWYSNDGSSWYRADKNADFTPRSIGSVTIYNNDIFIIGGQIGTLPTQEMWYSSDALNWTKAEQVLTNSGVNDVGTYTSSFIYKDNLFKVPRFPSGNSISKTNPRSSLYGNLKVNLNPYQARNAGAQWKLVSTAGWINSGTVVNEIPSGSSVVTFKEIPGWIRPSDETVAINPNNTTEITKFYEHIGNNSISVIIENAPDGAMWKLTSGNDTNWKQSGDIIENLEIGFYTIIFKGVTDYTTPPSIDFEMLNNASIEKTSEPYVYNE